MGKLDANSCSSDFPIHTAYLPLTSNYCPHYNKKMLLFLWDIWLSLKALSFVKRTQAKVLFIHIGLLAYGISH